MPRFTRLAPAAAVLVAGALALATPRPASAQLLKGIKKAAADAARKKAEEKIDGKPAEAPAATSAPSASSTSSAATAARQPDSRDRDVAITAERLDLILASYRDVLPAIEKRAKFFAQADSAERSRERFDACVEKAKEALNSMSQAQQQQTLMGVYENKTAMADMERWQKLSVGLMQRSAAITDRSTPQAVALADSTEGVTISASLPMLPGTAKCGKYPFMSPGAAQALSARLRNVDETGNPTQPIRATPTDAAKAAMGANQYGRIHERVAFWVLQQAGFYTNGEVAPPFAPFTDAENAAMSARKRDLQTLSSALSQGLVPWTRWSATAW
ncbi:MAG: hypothetical protein MUF00_13530 [Gemmatimonadaceae bacterium]|jgi:hypothetical protein|nr:hypothetical protein [Gemmatimonadaceae bacterium]